MTGFIPHPGSPWGYPSWPIFPANVQDYPPPYQTFPSMTEIPVQPGLPDGVPTTFYTSPTPYPLHTDVPTPQNGDEFLYSDTKQLWSYHNGWLNVGTVP
jgi:hypothetical protein